MFNSVNPFGANPFGGGGSVKSFQQSTFASNTTTISGDLSPLQGFNLNGNLNGLNNDTFQLSFQIPGSGSSLNGGFGGVSSPFGGGGLPGLSSPFGGGFPDFSTPITGGYSPISGLPPGGFSIPSLFEGRDGGNNNNTAKTLGLLGSAGIGFALGGPLGAGIGALVGMTPIGEGVGEVAKGTLGGVGSAIKGVAKGAGTLLGAPGRALSDLSEGNIGGAITGLATAPLKAVGQTIGGAVKGIGKVGKGIGKGIKKIFKF